MKTVLQALKDEVHYKLSSGFFENRLLLKEVWTEMKYAPSTFLKANRSKVLWPTVS